MLVALADRLDEQVVGAGGDHDVVDLVELGDQVGGLEQPAADPDADHRLAGEPELHGVGDRDDLHHAALDQPLDALADGGLGQADDLADGGVGATAVLLELGDDLLGDAVELGGGAGGGSGTGVHPVTVSPGLSRVKEAHGRGANYEIRCNIVSPTTICLSRGRARATIRAFCIGEGRGRMAAPSGAGPESGGAGCLAAYRPPGAGFAGFAALSAAALQLPFFEVSGAQQDPALCKATDISASDKKLIISNWPAYIDPKKKETSTLQVFQQQTGITVELHRRRQRQRRVLRQGAQPDGRLRAHRPRHDDAHRLDGRPDDRAGLDPAAGRGPGPQPHQEPHQAAAGPPVGPRPRSTTRRGRAV